MQVCKASTQTDTRQPPSTVYLEKLRAPFFQFPSTFDLSNNDMNKLFLVALLGCVAAAAQAAETDLGRTKVYLTDGEDVEGGGDAVGKLTIPDDTSRDATLEVEAKLTEFPLPEGGDTCSNKPMAGGISDYQVSSLSFQVFLIPTQSDAGFLRVALALSDAFGIL